MGTTKGKELESEQEKGEFKQVFRMVRGKHGLSMGDVARHLDVSVPYVADVEHGRRPPFTKERLNQLVSLIGDEDVEALRNAAMHCRSVELQPRSEVKAQFAHALAEGWDDLDDEVVSALRDALEAALKKEKAR